MKILHVIPGLSNASGPTQVVYHLAHQTVAQGHGVTVCYIQGRGTDPVYDFDKRIELRGFPAVGLRKWGYSPALHQYLQTAVGRFDIIHLHSLWLYPNIAVHRAARKYKVPYIIRPAGSLEPWALGFSAWKKRLYFALIEKRIINQAAAIHAVSEQEAINIQVLGFATPTIVVPNGIDISMFQPKKNKQHLRSYLNLPTDKIILLFLGRIHPVKNLEFILEVLKNLIKQELPVYLVIAGPDQHAYAMQIKKQVEAMELQEHCRFLGEVAATEKADVYDMADLFLLASYSENFAVAVAEALASGLPVMVSTHTPWASVAEMGSGYWLPLEQKVFADRIALFCRDEAMRKKMAVQALKHAGMYEWSNITEKMISVYNKVADENSQLSAIASS